MNNMPADDFDEFAADYREVHNKNMGLCGGDSYSFAEAKVLHLQSHEQNVSLKILDVGCGDAVTAFYMSRLFSLWKVTGIDVSARSIEMADKKKIPGAIFTTYNGYDFPFPGDCFDLVFIAGVLHHVTHDLQRRLVSETYRVLKKEGRIYIFEHNPFNIATRFLVRTCVFDKHVTLLRASKVTTMLGEQHFKDIKRRYITFFPRNKFFSFSHKAEKKLSWCSLGAQFYVRAIK